MYATIALTAMLALGQATPKQTPAPAPAILAAAREAMRVFIANDLPLTLAVGAPPGSGVFIESIDIESAERIPETPHLRKGRYNAHGSLTLNWNGTIHTATWKGVFYPRSPKAEVITLSSDITGGKPDPWCNIANWERLIADDAAQEIRQAWSDNETKIRRTARPFSKRAASNYLAKQRAQFVEQLVKTYADIPREAITA